MAHCWSLPNNDLGQVHHLGCRRCFSTLVEAMIGSISDGGIKAHVHRSNHTSKPDSNRGQRHRERNRPGKTRLRHFFSPIERIVSEPRTTNFLLIQNRKLKLLEPYYPSRCPNTFSGLLALTPTRSHNRINRGRPQPGCAAFASIEKIPKYGPRYTKYTPSWAKTASGFFWKFTPGHFVRTTYFCQTLNRPGSKERKNQRTCDWAEFASAYYLPDR